MMLVGGRKGDAQVLERNEEENLENNSVTLASQQLHDVGRVAWI